MAIIVSVVIIVSYCVYDRQRTNDKRKMKEVNERIDSINKQIDHLCDDFGKLAKQVNGDEEEEPVFSGQSHDSND